MVRTGYKSTKKKTKSARQDDPIVPSLNEIKKDKHRNCEFRRRQQETTAIDTLRGLLIQSKKYKFEKKLKLDRLQILGSASTYIQENVSALNILLGVLCNAVASSTEIQDQLIHIAGSYGVVPKNELLKLFDVPKTNNEFLDYCYEERKKSLQESNLDDPSSKE